MIKFFKESDEVLYPKEKFVIMTKNDLSLLKKLANQNIRQRVRFCAHENVNDDLHEMFVVHTKNCFVRPHFHINKPESLYVIEGYADLLIFNSAGIVKKVMRLSNDLDDGNMFYRLQEGTIHMLIIKSDYFIFHEVTKGPFNREDTVFPSWAPEGNLISDNAFIKNIGY